MGYSITGYKTGRIYERRGGVWGYWKNVWIKDAGVWYKLTRFHTNVNKGPTEQWDNSVSWNPGLVEIFVTSDDTSLDLYDIVGTEGTFDPATDAVEIQLFVASGVKLGSPERSAPALYASSPFVTGSELALENQGFIVGAGGQGGATLYNSYDLDYAGEQGGTAISLALPTTINNSLGGIYGGGGGGGGMMIATVGVIGTGKECGGGGGQGYEGGPFRRESGPNITLPTNPSTAGSFAAPGLGGYGYISLNDEDGYGGPGGTWGQAGGFYYSGDPANPLSGWVYGRADPGAGGYAVETNGFSLSWSPQGDVRGSVV
jgi:hypothetical protein